jgi:hypothetical protein
MGQPVLLLCFTIAAKGWAKNILFLGDAALFASGYIQQHQFAVVAVAPA